LNAKLNKLNDTIAALATAPGRAGLSVVRVSGPLTKNIANKILGYAPKHMQAKYASFKAPGGEIVDSGVALFFSSPRSYTGEDVLELTCHGGQAVVDYLLETLFQYGARVAERGEFTKRAFLNDKLDLVQAEAVADLIESTSRATAKAAQRSLEGVFSEELCFLSDQLTELRAEVEASLDFPDEDLKETKHRKSLGNKIGAIQQKFKLLLASTEKACRVREGITVVLSGKPNVGKSSLMNTLCGHERAIVNRAPGTTRDTLDETILLDGFLVRLIDTAGIRDTKNPIEREGVARAKKAADNADCILYIIDASANPTEKIKPQKNTIIVKNKIDLTQDIPGKNSDNERVVFCLSAVSKEGVDELVDHLKKFFGSDLNQEETFTARRRHLNSINQAHDCFAAAAEQINNNQATDLVAEELLQAQNAISEITGEFTNEDLLEKIFSRFCIGK
jgi:tRNA modification GTPase